MHAALALTLLSALGARPVVLLAPDDRAMILGPIIQSVQAQLADLPVELRVEPVPKLEGGLGAQMRTARQVAGTDGLAVVWMEISPGDPVFVYVADPKRNRVLARSVDWDGALGHLEAVGLIVRSSVQALLAGQTIGFEAQPVPIRKDVPRPVQPAEVGNFHVGLMVGYTPELLGGEAPVTHGLDVAAAVGYGDYAFARLGYRFMAPFLRNWSTNSVALVWRNPFTLGVGAQLPLGRVRLGAEIAGTLDIVSLDTRDVGPWVATAPSQDQLIFSLTPSVFASVRVVDPLSLFLSVSADIPLTDRHYLVHLSMGRDQTILTPYEVQPRGVIGLRFDIF